MPIKIRLSENFYRGMQFTQKKTYKKTKPIVVRSTLNESWNNVGKYMFHAIKEIEEKNIHGK